MTDSKTRKRKGGLRDVHRSFIVQQLACFMSPSETAEAVNEEFGLTVTRQAMERYDPHKHAGRLIGKRWKDLFGITRQAFLDDVVARVPEANKSVRVQKLAKASRTFEKQKNFVAMGRMLEMIAKEIGGAFTNKHELTGAHGGPIRYADIGDMTDEQIHAELRSYGIDPAQIHAAPKTTQ